MDSTVISSRRNPLLKELQAVRDDPDAPFLFLEGPRLVQEALAAGCPIEKLVASESFQENPLLETLRAKSKQVYHVSDSVFKVVSSVDSPQGLLVIAQKPSWQWNDVARRAPLPLVILDGLQDPGNAASIVRTAEAAGVSGLVTTPGTARLYSPKALRGAMGSSLRLPILEHRPVEEIVAQAGKLGFSFVAAMASSKNADSVSYLQIDWTGPLAIILGQEAGGISPSWTPLIQKTIYIPMQPPVESLNVASSAAILLYESFRQRFIHS
ncbi:MAG: RNA methyltransferase [Elusimicrobiota bacterium]|jgi:TrmH family RNA methyltransferase